MPSKNDIVIAELRGIVDAQTKQIDAQTKQIADLEPEQPLRFDAEGSNPPAAPASTKAFQTASPYDAGT